MGLRVTSRIRRASFIVAGTLVVAVSPITSPAMPGAAAATVPTSLPALAVAEQRATDLGSLPAETPVTFTLTMKIHDSAALQALISAGGHVTPGEWNSEYGPSPSTVATVREVLERAGLTSTWQPGDDLVPVTGTAAAAEYFLHVGVERYALDDTVRFYAPRGRLTIPATLGDEVSAVTGLDDYPELSPPAIPNPGAGLSPAEVARFYDMTPLRKAGLDGAGMTVLFIEGTTVPTAALNQFAAKFKLPPFEVTTHTDPSAWGPPATKSNPIWSNYSGEVALDLEIVHGLAPGAREVVYVLGNQDALPQMAQDMVTQNPGAIISASYTMGCEALVDEVHSTEVGFNAVTMRAAAEGTTIMYASGDRGAFQCLNGGYASQANTLSVDGGVASPYVTGVGGTTALLASNGNYYKEAIWGEPLETWGSGGGLSDVFKQPSYQVAPGLGAKSLSGRGVPDVSADADPLSGWDMFAPSAKGVQEYASGGTSAATPCWAAISALIDQDLKQKGLPMIGFANPALYDFARSPAGMPAVPFHQVTEGSNLHYLATAGWSAATGLGTPDVAHLADDFEWYERSTH
jgi:kumamolisin